MSVIQETYTEKERKAVLNYILQQFSTEKSVVNILNDDEHSISVVKITENGFNTYVTIGAGAYKMNSKLRHKQRCELVMCSTDQITDEQEKYIVDQLRASIYCCIEKGEHLYEFHTIDWCVSDEDPDCFDYKFFLFLRAAEPYQTSAKTVNFLVMLPLYKDERNWIATPTIVDRFTRCDPYEMSVRYSGVLLEHYAEIYLSDEHFNVNVSRDQDHPKLLSELPDKNSSKDHS